MTLEDSVHAFRLRVFTRAEQLGNVSAACREAGISRSLYYQLRQRFVRYGTDGLHPKRRRGRPGRPPQLDATTERQVLALSLAWPSWGPQQLSSQLARQGIRVARSTVYRLLRRRGLARREKRFVALEGHSARRAGLLTERTRKAIAKARPMPSERHVEAKEPGELVCLDCFYVGNLKGVGKVWQLTACDAASSYGLATLFVGDPNAATAARFLREIVAPEFRRAGFKVKRRPHRPRQRVQGGLRARLPAAPHPPHPHQATARLHQRLRRAPAADDPARPLAHRVQKALLHPPAAARSFAAELPAFLQPRPGAPRLSNKGLLTRSTRLGSSRC